MQSLDKETQPETAVAGEPNLVSIIIPTRNESPNIRPLLKRLTAALAAEISEHSLEVLFVDDSDDDTPLVIAQAAAEFPFVVRGIARPLERRNGLSGAVVEGFQAALGTWLCVMDADLQHPPELVPALLARAIEAHADIVVGSRKCDFFGPLGLSRKRAMTSQMLTLLARAWFPRLLRNVSDPLTGLFLIRRAAIDTAVLRPNGFKILLEILIRCPGLRVSEIHFDFANRQEGESKADFQEGLNFFRHLLRLRLTANQSFPKLAVVALASLLLDTAVFVAAQKFLSLPYLVTAVFLAQFIIILRFYLTEKWVLGGSDSVPGWPSLRRFWITNQLSLLFVRVPLLVAFVSVWHWSLMLAILVAIIVESIVRYTLSEQWVFSRRGITMWQPGNYQYDIHGILCLESPIPLPELAYFFTAESLPHVDIQIRVDRFGTPTPQPGAIVYSERLSRFGFGMAVMPGNDFTEIVISPLLATAPFALYKSILEPVLRWAFVQRGFALVYGASIARQGEATLIVPELDQGKTEAVLRAMDQGEYTFMSDDFAILDKNGRIYCFPKPVTVTAAVQRATNVGRQWRWQERFKLWLQNALYMRSGRVAGLQLSRRGLPVATMNIIWQRLWLPPKRSIQTLLTAVNLTKQADLKEVVLLVDGPKLAAPLPNTNILQFVKQRQQAIQGFPPYDLLLEQLSKIGQSDWQKDEQTIIVQALQSCLGWSLGKQDEWPRKWLASQTEVSSDQAFILNEIF